MFEAFNKGLSLLPTPRAASGPSDLGHAREDYGDGVFVGTSRSSSDLLGRITAEGPLGVDRLRSREPPIEWS